MVPEIRQHPIPRLTGRNWTLEAGSWKLAPGSWHLEAGTWKLAIKSPHRYPQHVRRLERHVRGSVEAAHDLDALEPGADERVVQLRPGPRSQPRASRRHHPHGRILHRRI